ncbi:GPW/gp25 family protein [Ekhidna sp.]|uniref:GPW/gp25 family protein n=1 Tax=Ekhidna sp. TaxID=2608089 RepID=UPI003299EA9E
MIVRNESEALIGIGWSNPPTFIKGANQVHMSKDVQNINENLKTLFSTHSGERISDNQYGTRLKDLIFSSQDIMLEVEVKESLTTAIKLFEPRILVDDILIDSTSQQDGFISIHVSYTIRKINSRHNFVYPFYINEGSNLDI